MGSKIFVQGSAHSGPVLTPAEALIAIHRIDPEREGIPLKKAYFFTLFDFRTLLRFLGILTLRGNIDFAGHRCMQCLF